MRATALALATVLAFLLAGCAGASTDTVSSTSRLGTPDTAMKAGGLPTVAGLNWTLGHSWKHELRFGNSTNGPLFTITAIVAQTDATGWTLATDSANTAVADVGFFLQDIGKMGRDGTLADGPFAFPYYSFPLSDNKTWTASEKNVDPNTIHLVERSLTMTAHWSNAEKRFLIEARSGSQLRARYDYSPKEHWFTSYEGYSGGSTVHLVLKESKDGYKGPAFTATGKSLYNFFAIQGGAPAVPPVGATATTFTMTAQMTHLMFLQFAFGVPGEGATELIAPDGTSYHTYGVYDQNGAAAQGDFAQTQNIVAAQAGSWQIHGEAAGVFVQGYGLFAWGATVVPVTV